MRVLVTGASGFVGSAVLRQLALRGLEVFAVSRQARWPITSEQWVELSQPEEAAAVRSIVREIQPQVVLHLAGAASADSYSALYRANVIFAANVLDASMSLASAPRVLLLGSAAEYGPVPHAQLPVDEGYACRPNTAYGISKMAQTYHALAAAANGLPVAVARLFNPLGAGMLKTLALGSFADQIARMGAEGGTLSTGDLDVVRDFIDVDVAADAIVHVALKHQGGGEIVNVCSGHGLNVLDLTRRLIDLSGVRVNLQQDLSRRGNSNVRAFVGNPRRLRALGFESPPLNVDALLSTILREARQRRAGGAGDSQ